jgi:hypothetical protein
MSCSIDIDECVTMGGNSQCINGGSCVDRVNRCTCDCVVRGPALTWFVLCGLQLRVPLPAGLPRRLLRDGAAVMPARFVRAQRDLRH